MLFHVDYVYLPFFPNILLCQFLHLHHLTNGILNALNNNLLIDGIFCDLEKAFDCVNHKTLLTKLEFCGITVNHYKLFESCLMDRYQRTHDKSVPVTEARRVLRLRIKERPPIWRVAANIFNKQSQTAEKGWSFSFGVGRGANNSSP